MVAAVRAGFDTATALLTVEQVTESVGNIVITLQRHGSGDLRIEHSATGVFLGLFPAMLSQLLNEMFAPLVD